MRWRWSRRPMPTTARAWRGARCRTPPTIRSSPRAAPQAVPQLPDERGLLLRRPDDLAGGRRADPRARAAARSRWTISRARSSASTTASGRRRTPTPSTTWSRRSTAWSPYDWATFLRDRLDGKAPLDRRHRGQRLEAGLHGQAERLRQGASKRRARRRRLHLFARPVASTRTARSPTCAGTARRSTPASAAARPSSRSTAMAYDKDALKDAVKAAKGGKAPIELLVKEFDRYRTVTLDYHDGLRYPHLERIEGTPDYLTPILTRAQVAQPQERLGPRAAQFRERVAGTVRDSSRCHVAGRIVDRHRHRRREQRASRAVAVSPACGKRHRMAACNRAAPMVAAHCSSAVVGGWSGRLRARRHR